MQSKSLRAILDSIGGNLSQGMGPPSYKNGSSPFDFAAASAGSENMVSHGWAYLIFEASLCCARPYDSPVAPSAAGAAAREA